MPWKLPSHFAKKHNKKLKGDAAKKATNVANALLAKGKDEGTAIRIANSVGDKAMEKK